MSTAFKEWANICNALVNGHQSIILRKGGIHEGAAGFSFEHPDFGLFESFFHAQAEKTRLPEGALPPEPVNGRVRIRGRVHLEEAHILTDWARVAALQPFHYWNEDVIRERFEYDNAGCIHLAIIRVQRYEPVWELDDSPDFGGCRSWIEIPEAPANLNLVPALSDERHRQTTEQIKEIIA